MKCPYCHHSNRSTAKLCANCGRPLHVNPNLGARPSLKNRYRILHDVGQGGMGAVYLAEDTQLFGRRWIVKEMLSPVDPSERREAEDNFQREAKLLAQLRHQRIPEIHDYFVEGGKYYLVMELAEGENLEKRLEKNGAPLPEKQVLDIALQVCKILEYLGRQNPPVIHRDIKPANIIMDDEGQVKLVDFGIARAKIVRGTNVSQDTVAYGTPGYAPREQEKGQTEPRSDIYALGATMHHLLTGRDPRNSLQPSFQRIDRLTPNVSAELAQVVERMLDPSPSNRPSASELATTFERMLSINPFPFQSGDRAYSVSDLVKLCDRYQRETIAYLKNQHIEKWLAQIGRADLATLARTIRVELNRRKKTADPDEALERLLRALDPNLPAPQLTVSLSTVDLLVVRGTPVHLNVTISSNRRNVRGETLPTPNFYFTVPSSFECIAPSFAAVVPIQFNPYGAASNASSKATIIFKARQARTSAELNYTVISPPCFRSGTTLSNPSDLVRVSLKEWENAVYHFENGDISNWMRYWQRTTLANRADQLRRNPTKGLGELLQQIDSKLANAQHSVSPQALDFGKFSLGEHKEAVLKLTNTSEGILVGAISSVSPLEINPQEILCLPRQSQDIRVRVDTSQLGKIDAETSYNLTISFLSNAPPQTIPVAFSVVPNALSRLLNMASNTSRDPSNQAPIVINSTTRRRFPVGLYAGLLFLSLLFDGVAITILQSFGFIPSFTVIVGCAGFALGFVIATTVAFAIYYAP